MNTTTYSQLSEAEQRLYEAQQAVQRQQGAASAPQREMALAQSVVERLAKQARQERFQAAAREIDEWRTGLLISYAEMVAALEAGDVRRCINLSPAVIANYQRQDSLRAAALGVVAPDFEADAQARISSQPATRTSESDRMAWHQAQWAYDAALPRIYAPLQALVFWVSMAADATEKQIRQGLAFAATGQWLDAPRGYDPMTSAITARR